MAIARSCLTAKFLLVIGVGVIVWSITAGPASEASSSGMVRAVFTALTLLLLVLTPIKLYRITTLMTWFSFGAVLGFGLLTFFAVGVWALVPTVCVVGFAALSLRELDASVTWIGAILSVLAIVVMLPL